MITRRTGPPLLIALDAMGVLFEVARQVTDALLPFCASRGKAVPKARAEEAYLAATRGRMSSAELWEALGVGGNPEDLDREYVARLGLRTGALEFCGRAAALGIELACVTNHVAEWIHRLRVELRLDHRIRHWVVSSEVGARKPDAPMFEALLARTGRVPPEIVFVDDVAANVEAARTLGLHAVQFGTRPGAPPRARDFGELGELLLRR